MNLHEYQAKQIYREFGIPVPESQVAETVEEAVAAAERLGGDRWVVKAQVHAGGRGKVGGVKLVNTSDKEPLVGTRCWGPEAWGHNMPQAPFELWGD